jgi:hypothetical protein
VHTSSFLVDDTILFIPSPQYHHNHIIAIMKGTTFLATAIAAGTASAGVHKMPLKKVPLSKQLVSSAV